jgi:hypothetical protein
MNPELKRIAEQEAEFRYSFMEGESFLDRHEKLMKKEAFVAGIRYLAVQKPEFIKELLLPKDNSLPAY